MQTEKLQLEDVRYNPERSAFQAMVRIYDGGEIFDYPTDIIAPLNAEFKLIARGLTSKAQRAHRDAASDLRLRTLQSPIQTVLRAAPKVQESPLMMRVLKALAA